MTGWKNFIIGLNTLSSNHFAIGVQIALTAFTASSNFFLNHVVTGSKIFCIFFHTLSLKYLTQLSTIFFTAFHAPSKSPDKTDLTALNTSLMLSNSVSKYPETTSHTALMLSHADLNASTITPRATEFLIFSNSCVNQSDTTDHVVLIVSHACVNHSARPLITGSHVVLIFSQSPIQKFLNFSLLFHSTTNAATSPAMAATTSPIGLLSNAVLSNHVLAAATTSAALIPAMAVVTACTIDATFQAANAAPIPTTPASISGRCSDIHSRPSSIFGADVSIKFIILSSPAVICGSYFSSKSPKNSAAVTFNCCMISSILSKASWVLSYVLSTVPAPSARVPNSSS